MPRRESAESASSSSSDEECHARDRKGWEVTRILAERAATLAEGTAHDTKRGEPRHNWGPKAAAFFEQLHQQHVKAHPTEPPPPIPEDIPAFCRHWHQRFGDRASVHDDPRPGRPPKVPEEMVALALAAVLAKHPRSMHEMEQDKCFIWIKETYNVAFKTIWRQVCKSEKALGKYRKVEFKMPLSPEHVTARINACLAWLTNGVNPAAAGVKVGGLPEHPSVPIPPPPPPPLPNYYKEDWLTDWAKRIIYVDAKKIYIHPECFKQWGLRGEPSIVIEDPRVKKATIVLNYYAAVCYPFGGLLLTFVSGTKGSNYVPVKKYTVGYDRERCMRGMQPYMACRTASQTKSHHVEPSAQCSRTT